MVGSDETRTAAPTVSAGVKAASWLHLSDLHMGSRGGEVWWQVRDEFKRSIDEHARLLPIDMILVTGDITNRGEKTEFDLFDRFLQDLLGWLRDAGQEEDPIIVPVPGNHDLVRPTSGKDKRNLAPLAKLATDPDDPILRDLMKEIWEDGDMSALAPMFAGYTAWLDRSILRRLSGPGVSVVRSHFPGDLSVRLERAGRPPVTVVGLNSAWMQYHDGDLDRKIELSTQQLHWALGKNGGGSPIDRLGGGLSLLMMHHPLDWLSRASRKRFEEEIYSPERFTLCLHGHMHASRSHAFSESAGEFRYFFQAPSLFGLESYGTRNEARAMGYAWGGMDTDGAVRVWPYKRDRQEGRQAFIWDDNFRPDPNGRRIRPLGEAQREAVPATIDLHPWLAAVLEPIGHINISGIGSGVGRTRSASRYPIEDLYTTLRSRGAEVGSLDDGGLGLRGVSLTLADLLSRHDFLLIEGQPGAGKTTFLRLVATMLGRDVLDRPCPDGPSWRERHLRLTGRATLRVPLLLRLSELAALLAKEPLASGDGRGRLLDLLEQTAKPENPTAWRSHWDRLLHRGEAILLLDGLDEVADDKLRQRVFDIFRDARRGWDKAPVIVTSRPFGAEAVRDMGFHHVVIEPFGEPEIREFIRLWVGALYSLSTDAPLAGEAAAKTDQIIATILSRPAIRRLAANPVMLTCLCVVHWNEGDLPEGRARLYKAVIRWLIAARDDVRTARGFGDRFALEALAALALAMMVGETGDKVSITDLETAARAVMPLVDRHFPSEDPLKRAREWIRFECLYSGIIEESGEGRIRFWHLTFQEYLAAQALAWLGDGTEPGKDWWLVVKGRLDDLQWRETTELLPGALFDEGGGRRVDTLLERVLERRHASSGLVGLLALAGLLAKEADVFGILGRLLGTMAAYGYKPAPDIEQTQRDLRDKIMPIFTREGAAEVPVGVRIAAAEALGRAGDPRLRDGTLIEVPGTGGVKLAKYLVTVGEYLAFVEAGGYDEPKWWQGRGWEFRRKGGWTEPAEWAEQSQHPNRPVTGVSWHEADAYCRWLTAQSGQTFRLPTEKEWDAAAMSDRREYPWGAKKPRPDLANYARNAKGPTPVGVYPAGDGPLGHCDLAGNVWEWSGDPCTWVGLSEEDIQKRGTPYVVRGGAWRELPEGLQAASLGGSQTVDRDSDVGFRVAAAPASTA